MADEHNRKSLRLICRKCGGVVEPGQNGMRTIYISFCLLIVLASTVMGADRSNKTKTSYGYNWLHKLATMSEDELAKPTLGISMVNRDDALDILHSLEISAPPDCVIVWVLPRSPIAKAGINTMDILYRINGQRVRSIDDCMRLFDDMTINDEITLAFRHWARVKDRLIAHRKVVKVTPEPRRLVYKQAIKLVWVEVDGNWIDIASINPIFFLAFWYDELAELDTLRILKEGSIGAYGIMGGRVSQILGPNSMIVNDNNMGDIKIVGFKTVGIIDGAHFVSPSQIMIVDTWSYITVMGSKRTIWHGIPIELILGDGLSDDKFERLLEWHRNTISTD